jgi:ABC-type iron transport system FetAB permease component
LPRSGAVFVFCAVGIIGVVEACIARSRTTSNNIVGRRGWVFASGEGGAVTWMTVLKARRNCRAERLSGKT